MVLRYRRKQRKLYDLSLQQPSTVPNNAEAVAATKAKVLYDDNAFNNPVYSEFTSPPNQNYEDVDKNLYDVPPRETNAKY